MNEPQELPHRIDEWPVEWRTALEGRATFIHKKSGTPLDEARHLSEKIQRGRFRVGDSPLGVGLVGLPAYLNPNV